MTSANFDANPAASGDGAPVPVTILTGFLGAGKTTLLKRLLDDPHGVRFGVLINDFGAINIDAELVVESEGDQVSLANGCVCCTIRDDLVGAIETLLSRETPPDRIVIEASGISRPLPIADALEVPQFQGRAVLDGIFCLVDGAGFRDLDFAATELAIDQAVGADVVVLNKIDIAPGTALDAVEETLRGPMPRLRVLRTKDAEVSREIMFGTSSPRTGERSPVDTAKGHKHAHSHDHDHDHDHADQFDAWHWQGDLPLDAARLRRALKNLPAGVLRAKGVFCCEAEASGRLVFQQVGRRSTFAREDGDPPKSSAIVAIARSGDLDHDALTEALESCCIRAE